MRRFAPLLLLLALAACDTAGPLAEAPAVRAEGLRLDADRDAYRRGGEARLALVNAGPGTYVTGVLGCGALERWDGQAWSRSPYGNDRACIAIGLTVEPGGRLDGSVELDVPSGSYRVVHSLSRDGREVRVATAAFRVG